MLNVLNASSNLPQLQYTNKLIEDHVAYILIGVNFKTGSSYLRGARNLCDSLTSVGELRPATTTSNFAFQKG